MQEPSQAQVDANYGYRIRQLERRPGPVLEPVDIAHLFAWNYVTDNTVPDKTWTTVANFGLNRGYFEEKYQVGDWSVDYDSGTIGSSIPAAYLATGWAQFVEDAADGEQRMVAICFDSTTNRYINEYTFQTDSVGEGQAKLIATTPWIQGAGSFDAFLAVWQNSGGDLTINDAEIAVYRMRPVGDANHGTRP
jgi:hypothetical protein